MYDNDDVDDVVSEDAIIGEIASSNNRRLLAKKRSGYLLGTPKAELDALQKGLAAAQKQTETLGTQGLVSMTAAHAAVQKATEMVHEAKSAHNTDASISRDLWGEAFQEKLNRHLMKADADLAADDAVLKAYAADTDRTCAETKAADFSTCSTKSTEYIKKQLGTMKDKAEAEHVKYGNKASADAETLGKALKASSEASEKSINIRYKSQTAYMSSVNDQKQFVPPAIHDPYRKAKLDYLAAPPAPQLDWKGEVKPSSYTQLVQMSSSSKYSWQSDPFWGDDDDMDDNVRQEVEATPVANSFTNAMQTGDGDGGGSDQADCETAKDNAFEVCREVTNAAYKSCEEGYNAAAAPAVTYASGAASGDSSSFGSTAAFSSTGAAEMIGEVPPVVRDVDAGTGDDQFEDDDTPVQQLKSEMQSWQAGYRSKHADVDIDTVNDSLNDVLPDVLDNDDDELGDDEFTKYT